MNTDDNNNTENTEKMNTTTNEVERKCKKCKCVLENTYTLVRCTKCLEKERENDRKRKDEKQKKMAEEVEEGHKICSHCYKKCPLTDFVGKKENTTTANCITCRNENAERDKKRDVEHRREVARINDKKEERKQVKQEWKENNYEKVVNTWTAYRGRQMNENQEEYLKRNAERMKEWTKKNKDKVAELQERRKNDTEYTYKGYKRISGKNNVVFELTLNDFTNIVNRECHYCGCVNNGYGNEYDDEEGKDTSGGDGVEEGNKKCGSGNDEDDDEDEPKNTNVKRINGVDKQNCDEGYILQNCVSCCGMCNMMKGTMNEYVFIKRCEHILSFNGKIQGEMNNDLFPNHNGISIGEYKYRANKKKLPFEITPDEYITYVNKNNCYICGKQPTATHKNGIDRVDNTLGYIKENIQSCCGECNYMKNKFDYNDFMDKIENIYNNYKEKGRSVEMDMSNPFSKKTYMVNKKSKEELKETERIRIQEQTKNTKERHNDAEYITAKANELKEKRLLNKK